MKKLTSNRGFTLIELLVVIGIIVVMAAAIGLGLKGDKQTALRSAQATVASLVSATRAQAALHNSNARLLINVDSTNPDKYLRYIVIQYQDTSTTNEPWVTTNEAITLPAGIAIIPNNAPAALLDTSDSQSWGTELESTSLSTITIGTTTDTTVSGSSWVGFSITSLGTTNGNGKIILGTTIAQPLDGENAYPLKFDNPNGVRGLKLSQYGVTTYINERSGFEQ